LAPDPLDPLVVDAPSGIPQQPGDLPVAVASKLTRQLDDQRCDHVFILSARWDMSLDRSVLI